ncbi:hypothetical protein CEP51_001689 [Fusarium floridanum]|uniref:DUF6594 domain-containing protein n=1 Tax=Fusarium floridanum TaxID=1325733 RepID=A0A428SFE3_9HYPO|nr:hypothetical protein CEP51_001689 [Fusarium floridanum]
MSGIDDLEMSAGQKIEPKPLGFAAVASLMASDQDQDLLIFRKFDKMSARNLLYLQYEALDLQSRIARLHSPDERVVRVAQNELWGGPLESDGQKRKPMVNGLAKNCLDAEKDLISLKASVESDPLSKALRARWPGKEEISRDGVSRISRANERSITTTVTIVNIIVAIILLVGPITSLSFVSSRPAVLGMICSFTVGFAMSVGLMTNAKRAEIFAGSAA